MSKTFVRRYAATGISIAIFALGVASLAVRIQSSECERIFRSLHSGVYSAFRTESEDALYNTVAENVHAGPARDRIYAEIAPLALARDSSVPHVEIHAVDVLKTSVADRTRESFRIECDWFVDATISHWGHFHRFIHYNRAEYHVERIDAEWKITDVRPLQHPLQNAADGMIYGFRSNESDT